MQSAYAETNYCYFWTERDWLRRCNFRGYHTNTYYSTVWVYGTVSAAHSCHKWYSTSDLACASTRIPAAVTSGHSQEVRAECSEPSSDSDMTHEQPSHIRGLRFGGRNCGADPALSISAAAVALQLQYCSAALSEGIRCLW